jgi:hypothetical protein
MLMDKNKIMEKIYYDPAGHGSIKKHSKMQSKKSIALHMAMFRLGFRKTLKEKCN